MDRYRHHDCNDDPHTQTGCQRARTTYHPEVDDYRRFSSAPISYAPANIQCDDHWLSRLTSQLQKGSGKDWSCQHYPRRIEQCSPCFCSIKRLVPLGNSENVEIGTCFQTGLEKPLYELPPLEQA